MAQANRSFLDLSHEIEYTEEDILALTYRDLRVDMLKSFMGMNDDDYEAVCQYLKSTGLYKMGDFYAVQDQLWNGVRPYFRKNTDIGIEAQKKVIQGLARTIQKRIINSNARAGIKAAVGAGGGSSPYIPSSPLTTPHSATPGRKRLAADAASNFTPTKKMKPTGPAPTMAPLLKPVTTTPANAVIPALGECSFLVYALPDITLLGTVPMVYAMPKEVQVLDPEDLKSVMFLSFEALYSTLKDTAKWIEPGQVIADTYEGKFITNDFQLRALVSRLRRGGHYDPKIGVGYPNPDPEHDLADNVDNLKIRKAQRNGSVDQTMDGTMDEDEEEEVGVKEEEEEEEDGLFVQRGRKRREH